MLTTTKLHIHRPNIYSKPVLFYGNEKICTKIKSHANEIFKIAFWISWIVQTEKYRFSGNRAT